MSITNFDSAFKEGRGMTKDDTFMRIVYEHSGEEKQVPLSSLVAVLVDFLDHFGVKSLSTLR